MKVDYSVEFPPGCMGLELEPVIKSSEREIGCRVKDFFYTVDHSGIDQNYLENKVQIGDIISYVNGEDVRSLPFVAIVELLKSLKDSKKTIWFKNISASWKSGPETARKNAKLKVSRTVGALLSPKRPPAAVSSELSQVSVSDEENAGSARVGVNLQLTSPKSLERIPLSPIVSQKRVESGESSVFSFPPRHVQRSLPPATPAKDPQEECMVNTPITPSALKKLRQQKSAVPVPVVTPVQTPPTPLLSPSAANGAQANVLPRMLQQWMDSDLAQTAQAVGSTALATAFDVTNALGNQAEHIVSRTSQVMPLYSSMDMQHLVQNKYDLLQELSHSVVLLGELEEKQKMFTEKIQQYEQKVYRMEALEEEVTTLRQDKDRVESLLQHANASVFLLERECDGQRTLLASLQDEVSVLKENNKHLLQQEEMHRSAGQNAARYDELLVLHARDRESAKHELESCRQQWQQRYHALELEKESLQDKLITSNDVVQQLTQEREDMRSIVERYSASLQEKEENMAGIIKEMQERYFSVIREKDEFIFTLEREAIELKRQNQAAASELSSLVEQLKLSGQAAQSLQSDKADLTASVANLTAVEQELRRQIESGRAELAELTRLCEARDSSLASLQGEKEQLEGSYDIAKLKWEAFEQEVVVLRGEIQSLASDLLTSKDALMTQQQKNGSLKFALQSSQVNAQQLQISFAELKTFVGGSLRLHEEAASQALRDAVQIVARERLAHQTALVALNASIEQQRETIRALELEIEEMRTESSTASLTAAADWQTANLAMIRQQEENTSLSNAVRERESSLHAMALDLQRASQAIEDKDQELAELRADSTRQITQLATTVDDLNSSLNALKQELQEKEGAFVHSLTYMESTHAAAVSDLRAQLLEAESILAASKEREGATAAQLVESQETLASLRTQCEEQMRALQLCGQQLIETSTQRSELLQEVEAVNRLLEESRSQHKAEVATMRENLDQQSELLQEMEDSYEERIKATTAELEEQTLACTTLKRQLEAYRSQRDLLRESLRQVATKLAALKSEQLAVAGEMKSLVVQHRHIASALQVHSGVTSFSAVGTVAIGEHSFEEQYILLYKQCKSLQQQLQALHAHSKLQTELMSDAHSQQLLSLRAELAASHDAAREMRAKAEEQVSKLINEKDRGAAALSALQVAMSEKEDTLAQMAMQAAAAAEKASRMTEQNSAHELELQSLRDALREAADAREHDAQVRERAENALSSARTEVLALTATLAQCKAEQTVNCDKIRQLDGLLQAGEHQLSHLQTDLEAARQAFERSSSELQEVRDRLRAVERERDSLLERVQHSETQSHRISQELLRACEVHGAAKVALEEDALHLRDRAVRAEACVESLSQDYKDATVRLARTAQELDRAQGQTRDTEMKVLDLESALAALQMQYQQCVDDFEQQLAHVHRLYSQAVHVLEQRSMENQELEGLLWRQHDRTTAALQQQAKLGREEREMLQRQVLSARQDLERQMAEASSEAKLLESLREQVTRHDTRFRQFAEEAQELRCSSAALQSELDLAREECKERDARLQQADQELALARSARAAAEALVQPLRQRVAEEESARAAAEALVQPLRQRVAEEESARAAAEALVQPLRQRVAEEESTRAAAEALVQPLRQRVAEEESARAAAEALVQPLRQRVAEEESARAAAEALVQPLRQRVAEEESARAAAEALVQPLRQRVAEEESARAAAEALVQPLRQRVAEEESARAAAEALVQPLRQRVAEEESARAAAEALVQPLRQRVAEEESARAAAEALVQPLRQRVAEEESARAAAEALVQPLRQRVAEEESARAAAEALVQPLRQRVAEEESARAAAEALVQPLRQRVAEEESARAAAEALVQPLRQRVAEEESARAAAEALVQPLRQRVAEEESARAAAEKATDELQDLVGNYIQDLATSHAAQLQLRNERRELLDEVQQLRAGSAKKEELEATHQRLLDEAAEWRQRHEAVKGQLARSEASVAKLRETVTVYGHTIALAEAREAELEKLRAELDSKQGEFQTLLSYVNALLQGAATPQKVRAANRQEGADRAALSRLQEALVGLSLQLHEHIVFACAALRGGISTGRMAHHLVQISTLHCALHERLAAATAGGAASCPPAQPLVAAHILAPPALEAGDRDGASVGSSERMKQPFDVAAIPFPAGARSNRAGGKVDDWESLDCVRSSQDTAAPPSSASSTSVPAALFQSPSTSVMDISHVSSPGTPLLSTYRIRHHPSSVGERSLLTLSFDSSQSDELLDFEKFSAPTFQTPSR